MGYDRQPHSRDELTIDNNVKVKHFCKDTVSINGAVRLSRRMMAIYDAELIEVRYPRVSAMFPSAIGSGSEGT